MRDAPQIFDAHFHVIDPRFPLIANQGYLPPAYPATAYVEAAAPLGVVGGAVVSGSFQGTDQSYLIDALARLGPGFVGVTQLPRSASDDAILDLDARGVRAVRFNLHRGGSEPLDDLEELSSRVHDLAGWHVEFYADGRELAPLLPRLRALPKIVIDHLGLSTEGLPTVLALAEHGAHVKASGFGRVTVDVAAALKEIAAVNPSALMFGTDLPSTRARRPFASAHIDLVRDTLGEDLARRVLHDNAVALYRPKAAG